MAIYIEKPALWKSEVCEQILRALPQWFGIEGAVLQYLKDIETMPTLVARADDEVVGFLTIKRNNEYSAEVHVMGVRPDMHRRGIGKELIRYAETILREDGVEYLQVKTLSPSRPDKHYDRTRAFYFAMGFRPLQELEGMWDEANPCLLMAKKM